MVTTIKITTDGVFIQTNSNSSTIPRIRTDANGNVTNRLSNAGYASTTNKTSIGIANNNGNENAPQSLPILPITTVTSSDLISPFLVKTITRTRSKKKPNETSNKASITNHNNTNQNNNNNYYSPTSLSSSSSSTAIDITKPIHKIIRIDKNGNVKCIQRASNTSNGRQWDNVTSQKNNADRNNNNNHSSAVPVRRRNTFKHYLIECKDNLVRRLSTSTPIIIG